MTSPGACSRRGFLQVVAATSAGACVGCGEAGVDLLTEDFEVRLSEHSGLDEVGKSVLVDAGTREPIAITLVGVEDFIITASECTHEPCGVQRKGDGWVCPCHGARFSLDGTLEAGPAKRDLSVYEWTLAGDVLTIIAP